MAYTNDEVGHFRHVLKWHPTSDESYSITCTYAQIDGGQNPSGVSVASGTAEDWPRMIFTLAGIDGTPGAGIMGFFSNTTMIYGRPSRYLLEPSSDTPAAQIRIVTSGGATNTWTFVRHGDAYEIQRTGTTLCMTAGTYASSSTMSTLALTEYSGAANQLWRFTVSERTYGIYSIRPSAATNLAISMPGETTALNAQAGLLPVDETSASQPVATFHTRLQSTSGGEITDQIDMAQARDTADRSWPARGYRADDLDALYEGTALCVQSIGTIASSFWCPRISSTNAWAYDENTTYMARQLVETASLGQSALDSSGITGTEELSNLIYFRPVTTGTGASDAAQYWLSIPQNVYDAGIATPYDMRIRIIDQSTSEEQEFTGAGYVDGTHTLSIIPNFILSDEQEELTATMRIRYRGGDGTWGAWGAVYTMMSSVDARLATGPQSMPGAGAAWIPSAFATDDENGRKRTTGAFSVAGLFAGHDDAQAAQLSISVRGFAYDSETSMYAKPLVGPAATQVITLARRPSITTTSIEGGPSGITIRYQVSNWVPGMTAHISRMTHSSSGAVCEDYDAEIYAQSGAIVVPWTSTTTLTATMARGQGTMTVDMDISTIYGRESYTLSRAMSTEGGVSTGSVSGTIDNHELFADITIRTTADAYTAYMQTETETGPRVIQIPIINMHAIATPGCIDGSGLVATLDTSACLIFAKNSAGDYRAALFRVARTTRGISSICYLDERGIDPVVQIIPIDGNAKLDYGATRDSSYARTIGSNAYHVGALPGRIPTIGIEGVIHRDQLASRNTDGNERVVISATIQDIYRIPHDARCIFRTGYGTVHEVRVIGVSTPRTIAGLAEVSVEMVEEV